MKRPLALLALAGCLSSQERPPGEPSFLVLEGFRMELLAREPLVADPVDLAYDENGLAYVVEMRDYPVPEKPGAPVERPLGRVRVLEDLDGDGAFDRSTVFAEGLHWPTSVAVWKGGVFVLAAPDLWYFKDSDGDRRADARRLVLTGFGTHNVQALANNLKWGLDHKIYGAGSGNGGEVRRPGAADLVSLRRRDFRFDPATGEIEPLSGGARFGNAFDDWGNRFISNIRNPVQHVVLPVDRLERNRLLAAPAAIHDAALSGDQLPVYRASPPEAWREERARRWALEGSPVPRSELVGAGFFTSACAATVYRGAAYPERCRGNIFLGEVAGNLIHRQILVPDGVTFNARRADPGAEFVASTDPWFRPVNFAPAPDGTLHVLDMYRETIEHPWSIPDDIKERLDLLKGNDQGRIYRLAPPGFRPPAPPRLGKAASPELVACLENPDAWWRETAHRLIYERQDRGAVEPLRRLLREGSPLGRLHALWSLKGLGALEAGDLQAALADRSAGVREHAVRLSGQPLAGDPSPRVRLEGALAAEGDVETLAAIARRDSADPWIRTAILSSSGRCAGKLLVRLVGEAELSPDLLRGLAAGGAEEAEAVLAACRPEYRFAVSTGLFESLRRAGKSVAALRRVLDEARATAADAQADPAERARATALLAHGRFEDVGETLRSLLASRHPAEVQRAAARALGGFAREEIPGFLLGAWREFTPVVRADALDVLLARAAWVPGFLDAVESGRVMPSQVPPDRRARLVNHSDAAIRERAARALGPSASRAEVVARYRGVISLRGDPAKGFELFVRDCKPCHRLGAEGFEVGPDLSTIRHRSVEEIVLHILDPNREVSPHFVGYLVELKDGRELTGIVAAESATSLTLRAAGGTEAVLLREDVARMRSLGLSLMPEGLEAGLDPRQMADLVAFLRGERRSDPRLPR